MDTQMMQEKDFIDLIAAYGGKPEQWPDDKRDAMLAFRTATPHAEALLGREAGLDAWLDDLLPQPEAPLQDRLEAQMRAALSETKTASVYPSRSQNPISRQFYASALTALAACFVGGFIAAPVAIDMLTGGADLLASLDIISDAFLPIEPL